MFSSFLPSNLDYSNLLTKSLEVVSAVALGGLCVTGKIKQPTVLPSSSEAIKVLVPQALCKANISKKIPIAQTNYLVKQAMKI